LNIKNYLITAINFSFKMRASLIASSNKGGKALVGHIARTGEKRNACRILMGKVEEKKNCKSQAKIAG
jgi:hypothetical protein